MSKPQDIAKLPWMRLSGNAWTTQEFRVPVLAWLKDFVASTWAVTWSVAELFTDRGIEVRVPYGPTGPPQEPQNQRPGVPFLRIVMTRADMELFEYAADFPQGSETSSAQIEERLAQARRVLLHQERIR